MGFKGLIFGCFFILVAFKINAQSENKYFVICNNENNATLNEKMLKEILYGELLYWPTGNIINPALYKSNSEETKKFAQNFFEGSVLNVQKHWLSIVFQGRAGSPPVFFDSTSEIMHFVETNKNAIAVIYSPPSEKVRLIEVQK